MPFTQEPKKPDAQLLFAIFAGFQGVGKSECAALQQKPLFLSAEHGGVERIDSKFAPDSIKVKNLDELRQNVHAVLKDDHDYKTLVIDTVDSIDQMFQQEVIDTDVDKNSNKKKPDNILDARGGFYKGYAACASLHRGLCQMLLKIQEERKMNIVIVSHYGTENYKPADNDAYVRFNMRIDPKYCTSVYIDVANFVGFFQMETYLKGEDKGKKRAVTTGDRQIICYPNVSSVAKNSYGINEPIVFNKGVNPLTPYIEEI